MAPKGHPVRKKVHVIQENNLAAGKACLGTRVVPVKGDICQECGAGGFHKVSCPWNPRRIKEVLELRGGD